VKVSKKTTLSIAGILSTAVIAASGSTAMAADVDVYAEGAYTAAVLVVYLYADINTDPLVSAGVKLTYDKSKFYPVDPATDPAASAPIATKNEADWYFGTADGTRFPYQDPQIDTNLGEVVFINGKIDENAPIAGVTGTRKLIGKVTFTRSESGTPDKDPTTGNAAAYFGASLGLGVVRPAPDEFANFVTTSEAVLDSTGVDLSHVRIYERGDANADGEINGADRSTVVYYMVNGGANYPWMDCNADDVINGADRSCIVYKITH